eukprot:TRINITY_DN17930_c0_g1_i1.p1 TRINITY_DN17930_c0_g1~~TRINITY_DN17930_c0_g1_i1.p1  ORF type:complete len:303 (+),score=54.48 TRINITY_DN17930_c0_g1_i1:54-962(+)
MSAECMGNQTLARRSLDQTSATKGSLAQTLLARDASSSSQPMLSVLPSELQNWLPLPLPVFLALLVGAVGASLLGIWAFLLLVVAISIASPIIYQACMQQLANQLKAYMQREDRHMFGVDFHIRAIDLNLCYGQVTFHDMQIDNPAGFNSKYLLKAKSIMLDVNALELVRTRGQHVLVEEMKFEEVDVVIEYDGVLFGSAFGNSNLQKVRDYMRNRPAKQQPNDDSEKSDKPHRKYTFQKVAFYDIGVKLASEVAETRTECADLRFKNFSEEVDSQHLMELLSHLVHSITETTLKSIGSVKW